MSQSAIQPTARGFLLMSAFDAMRVVEACLNGTFDLISRRPKDEEKLDSTFSGAIFCYKVKTGLTRWTDGLIWSPSRVSCYSLLYREVTTPGVKRVKRKRSVHDDGWSGSESASSPPPSLSDEDKKFIGSLVDSYYFKDGGLIKKTFSFAVNGDIYRVISYYTWEDAKSGRLKRPLMDPVLGQLVPRRQIVPREQTKDSPQNLSIHEPGDELILQHMAQLALHPYADIYPHPLQNAYNTDVVQTAQPPQATHQQPQPVYRTSLAQNVHALQEANQQQPSVYHTPVRRRIHPPQAMNQQHQTTYSSDVGPNIYAIHMGNQHRSVYDDDGSEGLVTSPAEVVTTASHSPIQASFFKKEELQDFKGFGSNTPLDSPGMAFSFSPQVQVQQLFLEPVLTGNWPLMPLYGNNTCVPEWERTFQSWGAGNAALCAGAYF